MPQTHPSRISIFIDGNNMFYAQQKNGWFFDPRRILEYFTRPAAFVELVNAFWYTGIKDAHDQRAFRDALISLGYTVRTKVLKEYYDESTGRYSQKANLDVEIVVDMFNTVDQYDQVILFSGDGDFDRAVELIRSKNTLITVVSTEGMIARELRNATDRYIDLNDIRDHIEKLEKEPSSSEKPILASEAPILSHDSNAEILPKGK
ncbi:MAG: NYN domain-containing protein [Synechococcales cyanobacterium]